MGGAGAILYIRCEITPASIGGEQLAECVNHQLKTSPVFYIAVILLGEKLCYTSKYQRNFIDKRE